MKFTVIHRGRNRRIDGYILGKRLRISLGTANDSTADAWRNKIERAVQGGADSPLWPDLNRFLPPRPRTLLHGKRRRFGEDFWHDLGTVDCTSATTAMKTK